MKLFFLFIIIILSRHCNAQNELSTYLKDHHYAYSLKTGFDSRTKDTLKQKLSSYKLILLAQGGSHYLSFYKSHEIIWIKFLHDNFGMTSFFAETGSSAALFLNNYLTNGMDPGDFGFDEDPKWSSIYSYNKTLDENNKIREIGIDFESPKTYLKALKFLLPKVAPQENISNTIDIIRNVNDNSIDCKYKTKINNLLKRDLRKFDDAFKNYYGHHYSDMIKMVFNLGNCSDVYKNRNKNMASTFLSYDSEFNESLYLGELGQAHTILNNKKSFAYKVNHSLKFNTKVCVINLYCYECTTSKEAVSNWPLKKVENDVLNELLPYCESDFTLFDFSNSPTQLLAFKNLGQFLIIAKKQN